LAIGTGGLIAVASGACVFGVAAVALVSVLHRRSEEKERASREKRKRRREYHDSLSVFSAQFSPPARRVDDDMMRHLLGHENETKQRTLSSPEPLFLPPMERNRKLLQGGSNVERFPHLGSRSTPPSDLNDNTASYPADALSDESPSSSATSLTTPLLVDNHFRRPAATLPGLRNSNNNIHSSNNSNSNNDNSNSNSNSDDDERARRSGRSSSSSSSSTANNNGSGNNRDTHRRNGNMHGNSRNIHTRDRSEESFSSPTTAREWLVDVNNLLIHEQIGRGGSCLVYRATYDKMRVAVKSLALPSPQDFHSAEEYEYDLQDFRQEAKMLARLRHENIVQFYGIAFTPKTLLLVEEYCPLSLHDLMARSLHDTRHVRANVLNEHARRRQCDDKETSFIRWNVGAFNRGEQHHPSSPQTQQNGGGGSNVDSKDEDGARSWWETFVPVVAEQVARGMSFLHRTNSIHRDLKPENVLLNEHGIFKICDFGVSRQLHPNHDDDDDDVDDNNHNNHNNHNSNNSRSTARRRAGNSPFRGGGGVAGGGSGRVRGSPVGRLKSVALSITGQIGTPVFMAPEMFDERPTLRDTVAGCAIDVYSYGMLMWAVWSREQPYHRLLLSGEISNPYQIAMRVTQQGLRPTLRFRDHPGMHIPDMPHDIEVLVESCWDGDPTKRPTFDRVLKILGSAGIDK